MHEDLIKRLRSHNGWALNETLDEAADVIEELSALVDRYGGETGIKNLEEYAGKYWDVIRQIRQKETGVVSTEKEGEMIAGFI